MLTLLAKNNVKSLNIVALHCHVQGSIENAYKFCHNQIQNQKLKSDF